MPWGEDKSIISRFFPEYLRVAIPMGLMHVMRNGGLLKGPIMNPSSANSESPMLGSDMADWRLCDVKEMLELYLCLGGNRL